MSDQQLWDLGIARLECLFKDLSDDRMQALTALLERYRKAKEAYASVVAGVDAANICRECAGQCCRNGKYRINVLDALAGIASKKPMVTDFLQKPLCPFGTEAGCTMAPGLRPADCILFVCDAIDRELSPQSRSVIAAEEQALRECIRMASCLTGEQLKSPLLLWAEKR